MDEEEFNELEPMIDEPAPILSVTTLVRQSIICLLVILGLMVGRRLPFIGPSVEAGYRRSLSISADKTFGQLAKKPIIREALSWVSDGWRSMAIQTRPAPLTSIQLIPPVPGEIVRNFGWQTRNVGEKPTFHPGIDLSSPPGRPVRASKNGTVHELRQDAQGNWEISLLHEGGWRTVYANCGSVLVNQGQSVQVGEEIGKSGKDAVEGEVVHWEVWQGVQPMDPRNFSIPKR